LRTERRDRQDIKERSERALNTEATLRNEPMEKADSAEPIDPMDKTEPTEPMDNIDPCEQIESTEFCDRIDSKESVRRAMTVIMPQDGSISEALASRDWVLQAQISGDVGQGGVPTNADVVGGFGGWFIQIAALGR